MRHLFILVTVFSALSVNAKIHLEQSFEGDFYRYIPAETPKHILGSVDLSRMNFVQLTRLFRKA